MLYRVQRPLVFTSLIIQEMDMNKNLQSTTGRGPIIANLDVTRERTQIFGPFIADDNNKW